MKAFQSCNQSIACKHGYSVFFGFHYDLIDVIMG